VSAPKKPTASEVWEAIDESSFRAEVDRVIGMSDAEVEAELLKDGFDPADLVPSDGEKAAPGKPTGGGKDGQDADPNKSAPAKLAPVRRLPVGRIASWAVAASVVLIVGTVAVMNRDQGVTRTAADRAAELREQAREACANAQWRTCLDRLDSADEIDHAGADDPSVKNVRHQAEQGLGSAPPGAPR
jgi:hypothetical protein